MSQMPTISGLIEKAIHTQLTYFFDSNNILHVNQHGLRKNQSTETAIFSYIKSLFDNYDNDESTVDIYIDYKNAFDTVSHSILLQKLKFYGF